MNQKLSDWANISQIISGVAIVVTIVVLIVEVRTNTEMLQTQTISDIYAVHRERNARLIENQGGIADIRIKVEEGDSLTRVEEYRYRLFLRDQLDEWEYQFSAACQFGRLPVARNALDGPVPGARSNDWWWTCPWHAPMDRLDKCT